jgi:hypothetical protein
MPSIQDIADQIDASLNQLNATTSDISSDTTAIRTELSQVDDHLQSGVAVLGAGLFAILEQERRANSIALHQVAQNNTIICWLDNVAELLCGMTRKMTRQIELQDSLVTSLDRLEGIAELVHSREAVEFDRERKLKEEIERCCPPEETPPEPCPEPCRSPRPDLHDPRGQDWQPPGSADPQTPSG